MEALNELNRYQLSVIESIQQENNKRDEALKNVDIDVVLTKARLYQTKLITMKKDMELISEKSAKLKCRALKLQEQKQKEALGTALEIDRQKQLEAQLSPVVPVVRPSPDRSDTISTGSTRSSNSTTAREAAIITVVASSSSSSSH